MQPLKEDTNGKEINEMDYLEKNGTQEDIDTIIALNNMDLREDYVSGLFERHPEMIGGHLDKKDYDTLVKENEAIKETDPDRYNEVSRVLATFK